MADAFDRLLPQRLGMVVRLEAKPGMRPLLLDALHRYTDSLTDEPATELFVISLDPDESDVVWLHEWFHGEEGVNLHRGAPGFGALMSEVSDLVTAPPGVMRFEPLRMHLSGQLLDAETAAEF
jgi:quinol monooxygenase YgiN